MSVDNSVILSSGVLGSIGIVLIIALLVIPAFSSDTFILNGGSSGGTGESTQCINMASQYQIIVNSTAGNCYVRDLANGNNITIVQNSTHLKISSTGGESTTCANLGTVGEGIFASGNCNFKRILAGTGISLSANGTRVTITNTYTCTSAGGTTLIKTNTAGSNCDLKGLTAGTGISVTSNTNDNAIGNTGVISNSCTTPVSCSGTNPSAISCSTCVTSISGNSPITTSGTAISCATCVIPTTEAIQLLCSNSLGSSSATLSCSSFTAKKFLLVVTELKTTSSGAGYFTIMRFNSDSGNNYSYRTSVNYGAGSTVVGTNGITVFNSYNTSEGGIIYCYIYNNLSGDRKMASCEGNNGIGSSGATAPTGEETFGKWSNTSAQITTITIADQSGSSTQLNTGSEIRVFGWD